MKGAMIVFDGNNGAGKTTQLRMLRDLLESRGFEVLATREPGGTPIAEDIRSLLLSCDDRSDPMTTATEALLFFAARAQHVGTVIQPALEQGKVVLCDRFTSSTIAFQCFAQNFPLGRMRQIEAAALGDFAPDRTFIFDVDVEEGLRRAGQVGDEDRIESIGIHRLKKAREGFLWQAQQDERFRVIDASVSPENVFKAVRSALPRQLSFPRTSGIEGYSNSVSV